MGHLVTGMEEHAEGWARTVQRVLSTPYPYAAQHVSLGPDDVDVTPERLHPAFHGSFDWHSSVHMHWSALRLRPSVADPGPLTELLDARLTEEHCAVEAEYLLRHRRFERPYGWAWTAMLAATATGTSYEGATRVLADAVFELVLEWLPRLAYPVRHGEHANTAFGLALVHEAAEALGREDVVDAIGEATVRWFGDERDYPASWEPGGSDFISPALCEADLVRRVLPADRFATWLAGFLPGLGEDGDPLLTVPTVLDRTDGKAVHLFGLALSRAWQLRLLAPYLTPDRQERVAASTAHQVDEVGKEIDEGDFMSTHWLVSFAVLAVTAG
jgi:hypothetical protein